MNAINKVGGKGINEKEPIVAKYIKKNTKEKNLVSLILDFNPSDLINK